MTSLKQSLSEAMKENGSWMTHMKQDYEVQLRTQKDMVSMYSKENKKLQEQNKTLWLQGYIEGAKTYVVEAEKNAPSRTREIIKELEEAEKNEPKSDREIIKELKTSLQTTVSYHTDKYELLLDENKKLKENKYDKFKCSKCQGHHTGCSNPTCDSCVKDIIKEIEELQKELNGESEEKLKNKECWMSVQKQYHELKDENKKLKEEIEQLKDDYHQKEIDEQTEIEEHEASREQIEELEEEIKELKEQNKEFKDGEIMQILLKEQEVTKRIHLEKEINKLMGTTAVPPQ